MALKNLINSFAILLMGLRIAESTFESRCRNECLNKVEDPSDVPSCEVHMKSVQNM